MGDPASMTSQEIERALRPHVPRLLMQWPADRVWAALDGTLVSADISGFTALSERLAAGGREGAEELSALVCDCFDGMIEDCHAHGGDIIKFGGDALLVWFSGDDHVRRACSSAISMRATIRRERRTSDGARVKLGISIGAHAGLHHFFHIRHGHDDVVVTGPGITATVDAESAASAGEILVTHATAGRLPAAWCGARRDDGVTLRRRIPLPALDDPDLLDDTATMNGRPAADFVSPDQRPSLLSGAIDEHRQVSISFITFSGTDALIEAGLADEVSRRLRTLTTIVGEACDRYGVHWLDTDVYHGGGKYVLASGAPVSRGGDEERLLRAMRDIIDADPGLELRAGVNRGYVFAGDLGSIRRRTYTTLGDAMNLAARLSAKAAPGEIVVSRPTMEWASSRFEYEPLEPFEVKGKTVLIYAGKLGRLMGRRSDLDRVDHDLSGRADELAVLLECTDEARAGSGRVVIVTGEPGIGKSRLALETLRRRPDFHVASAKCEPFDRLSAYSVTEPVIRSILRIDAEASADEAGRALLDVVRERAPLLLPLAPLLAETIAASVPATPEADAIAAEVRRTRTLQVTVELLQAVVREPTLALIDDVQNADDATRQLIEALAGSPIAAPLLVVVTSVPGDGLEGRRIELGPLDEDDVRNMIGTLLGDRALTTNTIREIVKRSDGNPLFAGELLRALAEDPHAAMPPTLEALVESRIDSLAPQDRVLLRNASVLGAQVDIMLLGRIVDDQLIRRQDRWDRLDPFLERVGPGIVKFRYDTYHRVVYEGLSFRVRRAAHRRVLEALEADGAVDRREELALLAFHAHRSADAERTWRYASEAAEAAAGAAMFSEAARLFGIALAANVRDGLSTAAVAERAGDVYEIAGDYGAADAALARALRLVADGPDRARVWRKRAEVAERMGDHHLALRRLARARRVLNRSSWTTAIGENARWDSARSGLALRSGDLGLAWSCATSALSKAELIGDWSTAAHAALMVDNLVTNLRWQGVVATRPDVRALYRRAADPVGEAKYVSNRAVDHYFDGDWREAMALYQEAAERLAVYGHVVSEATALNNIAEILSDQGRYEDALRMFTDASRTWRATGYGIGIALVEANLGRLASRTGRYEEAAGLIRSSIERFHRLGSASFVAEATLRAIENDLLAGTETTTAWPGDEELAQDPTLQIYAARLMAIERALRADLAGRQALHAIDHSVKVARTAGVPFELALSLRVRAAIERDDDATAEASRLFGELDVVHPPPLPSGLRVLHYGARPC